jgi:thiamine-phosphate pyrophosphorylase
MAAQGAAEGGIERLHRAACRLRARAKLPAPVRRRLAPLVFVTDPQRTPEPERIAEMLPGGSMIIFRAFGAADAVARGKALKAIARRRGLLLLAGADPALARRIGADGVHLPERIAQRAGAIRRARPGWTVTAAAHGLPAARRALRAGADAVLVSPVFPSRSPSAKGALGPLRFAALARAAGGPVYALGGVDGVSARRLAGSGAIGVAAVDGLAGLGRKT